MAFSRRYINRRIDRNMDIYAIANDALSRIADIARTANTEDEIRLSRQSRKAS